MDITIASFRAEHAPAFAALNRAWLVALEILEPADELQLNDPLGEIIARGGEILVALYAGAVIGTVACIPHGPDAVELAKLSVAPAHQRQGFGRRLALACVAEAMRRGVRRVTLTSSHRLVPALRMYESLGFRYFPMPSGCAYVTADIYMELDLSEHGLRLATTAP